MDTYDRKGYVHKVPNVPEQVNPTKKGKPRKDTSLTLLPSTAAPGLIGHFPDLGLDPKNKDDPALSASSTINGGFIDFFNDDNEHVAKFVLMFKDSTSIPGTKARRDELTQIPHKFRAA